MFIEYKWKIEFPFLFFFVDIIMTNSDKSLVVAEFSIFAVILIFIHVSKKIYELERRVECLADINQCERAFVSVKCNSDTTHVDKVTYVTDTQIEEDESDDYVHLKLFVASSLDRIPATDMCDDHVIYIKESTSAIDVVNQLHNTFSTLGIVITDKGYFLGVLEASDILRHLLQPEQHKNARYMLRKSIIADVTTGFNTFLCTLSEGNRHVAVVTDGRAFVVYQRSFVQYLRLNKDQCPAHITTILNERLEDVLQTRSVICC